MILIKYKGSTIQAENQDALLQQLYLQFYLKKPQPIHNQQPSLFVPLACPGVEGSSEQ